MPSSPPISSPLYLLDQSGNAWLFGVTNQGTGNETLIVPPPLSAVSQVTLIDTATSQPYLLTATSVGTFPSLFVNWVLTTTVSTTPAPNIIVTAPNGTIYSATVVSGQLQFDLLPFTGTGITPISKLAAHVRARLEENGEPAVGEFWSTLYEINTTLIEACNDLMLLIGRPTQSVHIPYNLTLNTVWQPMPKGLFLITNIWGPGSQIRKVDLHSMDYVQSSWGSDWQSTVDTSGNGPQRWFPVGLTMFGVHPAPSVAQTIAIDGIAYPTTDAWPYDGSEPVPFSDEFFVALEEYSAAVLRLKEGGAELQGAMGLYNSYLQLARRMTEIQDRRDPLIFSLVLGGTEGLRSLVRR